MSVPERRVEPTLREMVVYFLRLGAVGFGGPVALANYMRRDFVESRGWLTAEEYENGLALAAACPGPLAYQLAVYCGYIRFGIIGGLAVAIAFGLAPFVLVTIVAWLLGIIIFGRRLGGRATAMSVMPLFLFFFKTGLLVFGSGLVIVPFLKK